MDGLVSGTIFAIFWTLFVSWFTGKLVIRAQVSRPYFAAERVVVEGPANHLRGVQAVGGHLRITERRVRFMAHSVNIQSQPWHCSLAEVQDLRHIALLGIIDKGLAIDVSGSGTRRFEVHASRQ